MAVIKIKTGDGTNDFRGGSDNKGGNSHSDDNNIGNHDNYEQVLISPVMLLITFLLNVSLLVTIKMTMIQSVV